MTVVRTDVVGTRRRILVVSDTRELTVVAEQLLAPVPGGTGRYTAELLRALAETAPPGWVVSSVVAWRRDVTSAGVKGVRGPRRLPLSRRGLIALWQAGIPFWPGGDGVHAPTPLAPPRAAGNGTLSVTAHDAVPWTHPETLTNRGAAWHRHMIGRAARAADTLVVPTTSVAAELARHVPAASRATVVGHGVSGHLTGTGQVPVGQVPADLPQQYVLAVGTIEPRKAIDVLIEAVSRLSGISLVLVGQPGWGSCDPAAMARQHELPTDRLRVLGRLTDEQLAGTLRGASVLAVPSLAEGFGLPVLEAMAVGVPVVHSDAEALREVAGGAGRVVPRGDAPALATELDRVLGSPRLATEMATAGRARAAEFSWHRAARRIWGLHTRAASP